MIRGRGAGPITGLELRGAESASPSSEVLAAIAAAHVIVIGPSNPLVSIGPILAVPGIRAALAASPAPVVAVSPIVGGEVVKGPTAAFMEFAGVPCSAAGILALYDELLDGIVADEEIPGRPGPGALGSLRTDTRMGSAEDRARLARETVAFAESL
jgi:LPPG:FO 2-phospho-L-lactate transferase